MKRILTRLIVFCALLCAPMSFAGIGAASAEDMESLIGTWRGDYRALIYHDGATRVGEVSMKLTIVAQDGEFLVGSHEWQLGASHQGKPDIGGTASRGGAEDLVGLVSFDGKTVRLLETEDNGTLELTMVDANTLHAEYFEQGHDEATVFRVVLRRQRE